MADLPQLHCTHCGHTWIPRKAEPPKKCPRCQRPPAYIEFLGGQPVVQPPRQAIECSPEEREILRGVLEILRFGDRIEREAILRAVARRHAARGTAAKERRSSSR